MHVDARLHADARMHVDARSPRAGGEYEGRGTASALASDDHGSLRLNREGEQAMSLCAVMKLGSGHVDGLAAGSRVACPVMSEDGMDTRAASAVHDERQHALSLRDPGNFAQAHARARLRCALADG
mmetsp:Transcript_28269/g.64983  ORF Transcript_28269/g.64983 Transcript_28269/m.64983 type:complete len:126 (+) Transcript_28269:84-461(+)